MTFIILFILVLLFAHIKKFSEWLPVCGISTESAYVHLSVHAWKPHFPVDWRLLAKEHIDQIVIPLNIFPVLSRRGGFVAVIVGVVTGDR